MGLCSLNFFLDIYARVDYNREMDKKAFSGVDFYTTKILAQESGLTQAYVRQLCIEGKIQAKKVGRDWVISYGEAVRFLRERKK